MELPSYFTDFLKKIRLRDDQKSDLKSGHKTLRERLGCDEALAPLFVDTFLQGSYRRSTAIRPIGENEKADVDVIVVTSIDSATVAPDDAMNRFTPFLNEWYEGRWKKQGRSIKIELSKVKLDVVITSAPSEIARIALKSDSVRTDVELEEVPDWRLVPSWVSPTRRHLDGVGVLMKRAEQEPEWKLEPLLIPDRDAEAWKATHPLEQIRWTSAKNARCSGHYVNVVKALKWWRLLDRPGSYPLGYPLEHIIGATCPDAITSVAQGVTRSLEAIRDHYRGYADVKLVPSILDHGVAHNVFARITGDEFQAFHGRVTEAAKWAREALDAVDVTDSATKWQKLFGSRFPDGPDRANGTPATPSGGFTKRERETTLTGGRFA